MASLPTGSAGSRQAHEQPQPNAVHSGEPNRCGHGAALDTLQAERSALPPSRQARTMNVPMAPKHRIPTPAATKIE